MLKYISFFLVLILFFLGCKSTETITLPEHIIEIEDPNNPPVKAIYNASNTKKFDLIHTKLAVSFNWEKAYLYGKSEITLVPHFYTQKQLVLDARGMDLHKVQLISLKENLPVFTDLNYNYKNNRITINLPTLYAKTDTLQIFIAYTAKPNDLKEGGSNAITSDKGLYFINPKGENKDKPLQIWTQGETQSNSVWFPTIDSPNQKSTEEIAITVDEKYKTLSNGILSFSELNGDGTRTDFWEQNIKHAPYLFMMTIGEFEVYKDKWRDIEVNYYVEKEYAPYAKDIFGLTPEMITFFSTKLGVPYPWQKYSQVIVRDYVSGAMENTSAVIFGEFTHQTKREMIDGSASEDVISHELFHHWFGDLVTCESWANLPLNESFATYGEVLWREFKYGEEKADEGLQADLNNYLSQTKKGDEKNMIRFDYNNREDMFDVHTYQKGGRILHMLRNYIGDDAFFAALKLYLETNKYKSVEMHQFRLACENITGEDLNWFFNQWFYAKGHPQLNIEYSYNDSSKTQIVTVEQIQNLKEIPLYYLPLNIDIYVDGKVETKNVVVDKVLNTFSFDVSSKPNLVNFDADKMLLCEKIDNHKTIEEWVFMYNNAPRYLDRFEAIRNLSDSRDTTATIALINALNDDYPFLRRTAINGLKKAIKTHKEEVETKLLNLAKNDESSKVRGDAIATLSNYFIPNETIKSVLINGISEKSYYVIGKSLVGLSKIDYTEGLKLAKDLENEKNHTIINSIATIYSEHGEAEQNDFFIKNINKMNGFNKYNIVMVYAKYLEKQADITVKNGLPILKDVAENEKVWWIRMTGIKALINLKKMYANRIDITELELKELKNGDTKELNLQNILTSNKEMKTAISIILNEIKETEENPHLRSIMNN